LTTKSAFWDDLAHDLKNPEFLREYIVESMRIATIDTVVNALNEAREAAGLSKADLARAISAEPATIRRLFASSSPNPTLGTLAEVAAAVGMRITVEPLPPAERVKITRPLLEGLSTDTKALARYLAAMRSRKPKIPATHRWLAANHGDQDQEKQDHPLGRRA
jgi:transcriptional regulator with XRE-family HTH domain